MGRDGLRWTELRLARPYMHTDLPLRELLQVIVRVVNEWRPHHVPEGEGEGCLEEKIWFQKSFGSLLKSIKLFG